MQQPPDEAQVALFEREESELKQKGASRGAEVLKQLSGASANSANGKKSRRKSGG